MKKNALQFSLICIFTFFLFYHFTLAQGWEELAQLNNPTNLPVMAAADGKIYIVSGTNGGTATTYEYDPASNSWSQKSPIPQGCFWASAVGFEGKVYVMGGGQAYPGKNYNYIYDPANDSWSKGADLITPRMYHSASVADGKIYLIGGQNGDNTSEWSFEAYNPSTDTWESKARLLHKEAWYCGAVGVDKKFYRIAGGGYRNNLVRDFFNVYDTETDSWEELSPFPIKLHAPAAVNCQGKIIVMGGITNEVEIDSIFTYSPASGIWSRTMNRLPQPMVYHKAAVIGDYVYIYNRPEGDQYGHLYRYKFGNTDVVDLNSNDNISINIFPNPCSGNFNVNINGLTTSKIDLKIVNILGLEIYSEKTEIDAKSESINISIKNTAKGLYFVLVNVSGKVISKSIVIN